MRLPELDDLAEQEREPHTRETRAMLQTVVEAPQVLGKRVFGSPFLRQRVAVAHPGRRVVGLRPFELLAGPRQAVVSCQRLAGVRQEGLGVTVTDEAVDFGPIGPDEQHGGIDVDAVLLGQTFVFLGVDLEADRFFGQPVPNLLVLPGRLVELLAGPAPDGVEVDQHEPLRPVRGGLTRPIQAQFAEQPFVGPGQTMAAIRQAMNRPSQPTPFVRTMVTPSSLLTSVMHRLDQPVESPMRPVRAIAHILDD